MKTVTPGTLHRIAVVILIAGLAAGVAVYLKAGNYLGNVGYEQSGGEVYTTNPEDSKLYRFEMERYGGSINLVAYEIMQWFYGLWHGKTLALTIAVIAVLIYLALVFIANRLPAPPPGGGP